MSKSDTIEVSPTENLVVGSEVIRDTASRLESLRLSGIGDMDWWGLPRDEQFKRLGGVIGNTPIEHILVDGQSTVTVKRELDNPSGSHYDRAYLHTIAHFESIGFIMPGDELRDITSGSAGISLALIGHLLGYKVRITAPSELPANRLYPMRSFGAEVVDSGEGYVPKASEQQVDEILEFRGNPAWVEHRPADRSGRSFLFTNGSERICYLNHSENELSPQSFESIADEIAAQQPEEPTDLLLAEGNWTTIAGIAKRMREILPLVNIVSYSGEITQGSTENFGTNVPDVPIRFKDVGLVDQQVVVTNEQRDSMREVAPQYGRSSQMGLALAKIILERSSDAKIVTFGYDLANRY